MKLGRTGYVIFGILMIFFFMGSTTLPFRGFPLIIGYTGFIFIYFFGKHINEFRSKDGGFEFEFTLIKMWK